MSQASGYFEAYVNQHATRPARVEKALAARIHLIASEALGGCQLRWAGSQRKGTAIRGSDLDLCLERAAPVTVAERRALRRALEDELERPAVVLSHAVRLPAHGELARVDLAFANAAFGSRPLPDPEPFRANQPRQLAARALKLWAAAPALPRFPGWAVEALVLHLDAGPGEADPLALFLRIVRWLEGRATAQAVEGVLRPVAAPTWHPQWSLRLPGRLQAIQGHARALLRRHPDPEDWTSTEDVGRWLVGQ